MREILFRGKRTDNGEWVEGYYSYSPEIDKHMITTADLAHPYGTNFGFYKVLSETVGQYTGLHDKNGRKIFEGDIIDYNGELAKVVYRNDDAAFDVFFDTWNTDFSVLYASHVEVIGNIHDNPEMLKGGADNG